MMDKPGPTKVRITFRDLGLKRGRQVFQVLPEAVGPLGLTTTSLNPIESQNQIP